MTRTSPEPSRGRSGSGSGGWLSSSDSISHGRFSPGTVLDGRYRVIGLLGRGGMGEVYRADDLRLGQPVALKFLPDSVGHDPIRLAQFHNEVRTARRISHPNICRVHDIGDPALACRVRRRREGDGVRLRQLPARLLDPRRRRAHGPPEPA